MANKTDGDEKSIMSSDMKIKGKLQLEDLSPEMLWVILNVIVYQ